MPKKHKSVGKAAKKNARKAMKTVKRHGPLTAAIFAVGGVASSILASQKFRDGVEDLVGSMMTRASNALNRVSARTSGALARVRDMADASDDDLGMQPQQPDSTQANAAVHS